LAKCDLGCVTLFELGECAKLPVVTAAIHDTPPFASWRRWERERKMISSRFGRNHS
jgi:hypothetical protein